jgi:hypothetical protein
MLRCERLHGYLYLVYCSHFIILATLTTVVRERIVFLSLFIVQREVLANPVWEETRGLEIYSTPRHVGSGVVCDHTILG